jgi:hypothetical protein
MAVKKTVFLYILLATFSIQLIPIMEVGSILFGNQMIEEVSHGTDSDGKTSDFNEDEKSEKFYYNKLTLDLALFISNRLSSNSIEKNYASRLADDKPTRPPLEFLRY